MKPILIFLLCLVASTASPLTQSERKLTEHAKSELVLTQKSLATSRGETAAAESEAKQASDSAAEANTKADKAVSDIKSEVAKYHGHWGINAILLGLAELFKHLLILAIVIAVVAGLLWVISMTPWGAFVKVGLAAVTGFIRMAGAVISAFFRKIYGLFKKRGA